MKQKTLFIAPIGARNKKETIFEEIVRPHADNDFSSILYLAPNISVLTDSKRRFFTFLKKTRGKSAYIPFQTLTVKQLASNINEIDSGNSVISERLRTLILCGILKDDNIGYARLLSDLIYKIRHYISDKSLIELKEEIKLLIVEDKTRERAVRVIDILQSYENFLKAKKLIDPEDTLKCCIPIINQTKDISAFPLTPYLLPLKYTLIIEGFYDPTPLELQVMTALAGRANDLFVLAEEGSELHKHFHSAGMDEKTIAGNILRENIGYYSYPSLEDEVEGIAKAVKKRIIDGVAPWEITVTFPGLPKYLPVLKRTFRKHGIPLSISEYDMTSSRSLSVLFEMLRCIEEDYPAKDFLSFLTSPNLPAISNLVREWGLTYSYKAGIVKGRDSWLQIKDILVNTSGDKMSDDEKMRLTDFQDEIKKIIDIFEKIRKERDIVSAVDAFESALKGFGFFRSFDNISSSVSDRLYELRHFAGILQTVESPVFFIKYMLQSITGSDEDSDGVRVLPYELTAGLEVRELFFGGLIESELPSRPGIDPILPEKVKKELGMPYLEYYLKRQDLYFKRLLNCSMSEPYFSYPSADGDKMFLPSPFLDWGAELGPAPLNIFTEEDVLVREGEIHHMGKDTSIFWHGETFSETETLGVLRQMIKKISKGFFSVTDIDNYRKCPLRFYIERLLGFEITGPPRFEVEAMLWGSLAHKTMEQLFLKGDIDVEEMDQRLFESLTLGLQKFPISEFWEKVAREIFRNLLPKLKEQEKEIRIEGFIPYKVEEKISAEIGGIKLKGKIDRIDRKDGAKGSRGKGVKGQIPESLDPRILESHSVILLDYKTGSVDDKSLQMPLYAAMWQDKFSNKVEKTGFYSLKNGEVNWYPKRTSMDVFIQNALQQAVGIVQRIRQGRFVPKPSQITECRHCYHSPLCEKG